MDPLTALGLAANVFACVSFTSDLIKGAVEISTSPNGFSADVSKLDSVYNDLRRLCTGLEVSVKQRNLGKDDQDYVVQLAVAIEDLSGICKKDCNDLLQLLLKFKTKTGLNGKWSSFRVALRTVWGKKTIDELEQRLSKTQQTLTLHICILAHYSCRSQSNQLEDLQRQSIRLQSNQADTLKCISKKLDDVEAGIKSRKDEDIFTAQDVDCLKERLQSLSLSGHDVAREQSILQSLTFDSRPIRHEQIPEAHAETFKWALKKDPNHSGSMIGEWLAKGTGILWIAGKPGSGKSTLMKLMADSRPTSELVSQWAQPSAAIIASHYFWIAGTPMQKSHQGLLQTLLYEIFRQCPSLIQETCSHRRVNEHLDDPWSLSELHETLKSISCRDSIDPKFCFFIDGMDEFDGDHEAQTNLCRTFKELATLKNVKLVLSSRPWNIFEEQFGSLFPKLYVQDLTHDDIQAYAQSSLQEHPRWPVISGIDSQRQFLISEITKRSEGVFLWVRLVIKLLKQGLTNRDRLSDLYRRLQSFPTELEPFFKAILESVEPFYHSHMSTILQVALQAGNESLGFLGYHFHIQEYEDLNYALNLPIRLMDQENIQQIKSDMTWHLDSRTRGLLEVHSASGTVNFLHRTVRDFLKTREMHDFLVAKVNDRLKFNPVLSLLKAYVALIKVSCIPSRIERVTFAKYMTSDLQDKESQHIFLHHLWNAMSVVETLELDTIPDPRCRSLLDELDRSLQSRLVGSECAFIPSSLALAVPVIFRELLVKSRVFDYIYMRLQSDPSYLATTGSLLPVYLITAGPYQHLTFQKGRGTEIMVYILENRTIDFKAEDLCHKGITAWTQLLSFVSFRCPNMRENTKRILAFLLDEGILLLLLKAGADPNVKIYCPSSTSMSHWSHTRPMAVVYIQLCFEFLDQPLVKQQLYLDVLQEFLRLSTISTVKAVCDEFRVTRSRNAGVSPRHLPFLTRVNDLLSLHLDKFGAAGPKLLQDKWYQQTFPAEPHTSINSSKGEKKRKRENESDDVRCEGTRKR